MQSLFLLIQVQFLLFDVLLRKSHGQAEMSMQFYYAYN